MKKILRYYITPAGKSPFTDWVEDIKDNTIRSRILRRLERLKLGNYGDYKAVGHGIYELRFNFGAGYRVYFIEQDDIVVLLLCGGDKSTQSKDIEMAKQYWQELKERKS